MLLVVLDAAVRSTVLLAVVLLALKALRIRNPHVLMAAWQMVLVASLLMPLLVGWARFAVAPASLPIPDFLPSDLVALVAPSSPAPPPRASLQIEPASIDWLAICSWLYLLVAAWLLLRFLLGCALMWRLCRSATPVCEDWAAGCDVRMHPSVAVPVTFGSTILLPPDHSDWDALQRRAVLAHEHSHVRRADFYVLALASINRAVFWFNPVAWWLKSRIADLAETRSDVAAIENIGDRMRYAEILLNLASNAHRCAVSPHLSAVSLAMARPDTARRRIERILQEETMPRRMSWRSWTALVGCLLPLTAIAAGAVVAQGPTEPAGDSTQSTLVRRVEQLRKRTEVYVDPKIFDNYVGYYQLDRLKAFTVSRLGDRLYIQLTGRQFEPLLPESPWKFFYRRAKVPAQISFVGDAQGRATGLILHQGGLELPAKRIEEAEAKALEEAFAKRLKEPVPLAGSEAALRRQIEAFRQGQPAYSEMTVALATITRPQLARIQRRLAFLGQLQSISFRGASSTGRDIYEAKFENGMAIMWIYLADDGKVSGLQLQW